jgi:hypothetical protein
MKGLRQFGFAVMVSVACFRTHGDPGGHMNEIWRDPNGIVSQQAKHLKFGPRRRVLREATYGEGEAIGRLELPTRFASDLDPYALHPALLQAYLETLSDTVEHKSIGKDRVEQLCDKLLAKARRVAQDAAWKEDDHPRGQPGNAGQFTSGGGGGGGSRKSESTTKSEPSGSEPSGSTEFFLKVARRALDEKGFKLVHTDESNGTQLYEHDDQTIVTLEADNQWSVYNWRLGGSTREGPAPVVCRMRRGNPAESQNREGRKRRSRRRRSRPRSMTPISRWSRSSIPQGTTRRSSRRSRRPSRRKASSQARGTTLLGARRT